MVDESLRVLERAARANPEDLSAVHAYVRALRRVGRFDFCVGEGFEEGEGFYFWNVRYHGDVVDVRLSNGFIGRKQRRKLLSLGWRKKSVQRTQDQWVTFFRRLGGGWELPDAELYYALFRALFAAQGGWQKALVERIRKEFHNDFDKYWMITGTRVVYSNRAQHGQQDIIVHRIGTRNQYISGGRNLVGPFDWIRERGGQEEFIHALFGTSDVKEVREVCTWVSGFNPYLWRLTERQAQNNERAVVLGRNIDGDRFGIDCDGVLSGSRPARGVVVSSAREK